MVRSRPRAFCKEMERVSSVGAAPKTSVTTQEGVEEGSSYQVTKVAIPFWAIRPRAARSFGAKERYQGNCWSRYFSAVVDSTPIWFLSRLSVALLGAGDWLGRFFGAAAASISGLMVSSLVSFHCQCPV